MFYTDGKITVASYYFLVSTLLVPRKNIAVILEKKVSYIYSRKLDMVVVCYCNCQPVMMGKRDFTAMYVPLLFLLTGYFWP